MQQDEILDKALSEAQEILYNCSIPECDKKNQLLTTIDIVYNKLRNVTKLLKLLKDYNLWDFISEHVDHRELITSKHPEILRVFVYGPASKCSLGNKIRFISYGVGYVFCDKAGKCQCSKASVSKKVSEAKLNYSDEKKASVDEKRKATNLQLYGYENQFHNVEKITQSYIDKFGVTNPNKLSTVRDKIDNTNLARYGFKSPSTSAEVKLTTINNNMLKYGVPCVLQSDIVRLKIQNTLLERYGVKNPIQNKSISDKIKKTNLEKYGFENASKNKDVIAKILKQQRVSYNRNLISRLEPYQIIPIGEVDSVWNHRNWKCQICNNDFVGTGQNGSVPRCPICLPKHISGPQVEIANYIIGLVGIDNVEHNNRELLSNIDDRRKNRELDIVVESHNFAIEYCGLRWHTEIFGGKNKNYHYTKYKRCNDMGIHLMTIWSDEWETNQALLKSMISVRLGIGKRIYARTLTCKDVTSDVARKFFEYNHIQGYVNSSKHVGLYSGSELVMCLAVAKPRFSKNFDLEITRLASVRYTTVVGGASKLFKFMLSSLTPSSIISYCDLRFGSGKVYSHLGFSSYEDPTIGFEYVDVYRPNERYNRMKYQKHRISDLGDDTVKEYLLKKGIERLWDCGQQKFVWYPKTKII